MKVNHSYLEMTASGILVDKAEEQVPSAQNELVAPMLKKGPL